MTVLFYKVGDKFFKGYFDSKKEELSTNTKMQKCYVEYPYVDDIEIIKKMSLDDFVIKYREREVKFN